MEHLTNGWESETDAADSLVRMFVEGTAERGEYLAVVNGGQATRRDGVALADVNSPVWYENTATLLAPCEYLQRDAVVEAIRDFFPAKRSVLVVSAFPTWDLSEMGFELVGHPPFMVRPPGQTPPPWPADFEVRPVNSSQEMAVFGRVLAEGYPMPGAEEAALTRVTDYAGPLRLFNGYLAGHPIATGGTWLSHPLNDVGFIAALPAARRKGIGAAITYAATVADPAAPAALISSDFGQRVYESLGYLRLFRMTLWLRPPAA